MSRPDPVHADPSFGQLLRYLRKKARLTQEELGRAVGYGRTQITRLEKNRRQPDPTTVEALFLPALNLSPQSADGQRLVLLARQAHQTRPTPAAAPSPERRIPHPLWPLIGRQRELHALCRTITDSAVRLLTLLGPPGVGKTRLMQEVGQTLENEGDSDPFELIIWVEGASADTPAELLALIGRALESAEPAAGSRSSLDHMVEAIGDRAVLLLLDNLEQVVEVGPQLTTLLAGASRLKILGTSRHPLDVYGESCLALDPFVLPAALDQQTWSQIRRHPAVELLLARVQAAVPQRRFAEEDAADLLAICRRLDGLPLALELAAGQLRTLSTTQVVEQLHTSGAASWPSPWRGRPIRQTSLLQAMDWSLALLSPAERACFGQLALFKSDFDREAAAAVCLAEQPLERLVEANLVQVRPAPAPEGKAYFRILMPLREIGLSLLAESKDETVQERYVAYFVDLLVRAREYYHRPEIIEWQAHLRLSWPDILSVLEWLIVKEDTRAVKMLAAGWRFFYLWGQYGEGLQLIERTKAFRAPTDILGEMLRGEGVLAMRSHDYQRADLALQASLANFLQLQDELNVANLYMELGTLAEAQGDLQKSGAWVRQALEIFRRHHDMHLVSWGLSSLATVLVRQGEFSEVESLTVEMLRFGRESNDLRHLTWLHCLAGDNYRMSGQPRQSQFMYETALSLGRQVHDVPAEVYGCVRLAGLALHENRLEEAAQHLTLAAELEKDHPLSPYRGHLGGLTALHAWSVGRWKEGVVLLAASQAINAQFFDRLNSEKKLFEEGLAAARVILGELLFQQAHQEGEKFNRARLLTFVVDYFS